MSAPAARPLVIGHRGASALCPENTLAAFARALADGADGLECDVHLSADGEVVVMHDESIDRTADPASPLLTGTLAELTRARLDEVLLADQQRVPSLTQLLELLDAAQRDRADRDLAPLVLYVEVKVAPAAEAVAELVAGRTDILVISFVPDALRALRRTAPQVPLALIVHEVTEETTALLDELAPEALSVGVRSVKAADGELAHARGMALNVWTVNEAAQLGRALAAGVDTISGDDPAWLLTQLSSHAGR